MKKKHYSSGKGVIYWFSQTATRIRVGLALAHAPVADRTFNPLRTHAASNAAYNINMLNNKTRAKCNRIKHEAWVLTQSHHLLMDICSKGKDAIDYKPWSILARNNKKQNFNVWEGSSLEQLTFIRWKARNQ